MYLFYLVSDWGAGRPGLARARVARGKTAGTAVRPGVNKSHLCPVRDELGREWRPEVARATAKTHRIQPWGPSGASGELPQRGGSVLRPWTPGPSTRPQGGAQMSPSAAAQTGQWGLWTT